MAPNDPPSRKTPADAMKAAAVAWTLPFELIVPALLAGGIGYLLDRWWHTKPLFMLVLGLGGMVIGIVNAVKTASLLDKNGN
jgi:F0F1-type ATP synthase assembly protein I